MGLTSGVVFDGGFLMRVVRRVIMMDLEVGGVRVNGCR